MTVAELKENIHKILAVSIYNSNAYNRRSRGFISELEFKRKCRSENIDYLDGGWILFKGQGLLVDKKAAYITVSSEDVNRNYKAFYSKLKECPLIDRLFFLKIKPETDWGTKTITTRTGVAVIIPEPSFDVFEFIGGDFEDSNLNTCLNYYEDIDKNFFNMSGKDISKLDYLEHYSEEELRDLFCVRFFLDILMKKKNYSAPMDFDGIIIKDGEYIVVETKEKDPGPSNKGTDTSEWFFGWDSIRLLWYLYLVHTTDLNCWGVILEIDNQTDRNPVGWKKISIEGFCNSLFWGAAITAGVGMGGGAGSTVIAPYDAFEDF